MAERRKVTKPRVDMRVSGNRLWMVFYTSLYYPRSTPEYMSLVEPLPDSRNYGRYIKEGLHHAEAERSD